MKKLILVGEIRLSDRAVVHQRDLAEVLGAERLSSWPKDASELRVVVGKLLGDRKPALLKRAEMNQAEIVSLADVLTDDVRRRLRELLLSKPKLERYEQAALDWLGSADAVLPKPKRGKKK